MALRFLMRAAEVRRPAEHHRALDRAAADWARVGFFAMLR
jgi:hypothetical protein